MKRTLHTISLLLSLITLCLSLVGCQETDNTLQSFDHKMYCVEILPDGSTKSMDSFQLKGTLTETDGNYFLSVDPFTIDGIPFSTITEGDNRHMASVFEDRRQYYSKLSSKYFVESFAVDFTTAFVLSFDAKTCLIRWQSRYFVASEDANFDPAAVFERMKV